MESFSIPILYCNCMRRWSAGMKVINHTRFCGSNCGLNITVSDKQWTESKLSWERIGLPKSCVDPLIMHGRGAELFESSNITWIASYARSSLRSQAEARSELRREEHHVAPESRNLHLNVDIWQRFVCRKERNSRESGDWLRDHTYMTSAVGREEVSQKSKPSEGGCMNL